MKSTIFISLILLVIPCLQACNSKDKKIVQDEKENHELNAYIQKRKLLIKKHENQIFGIGLNTNFKDLLILMNPSLVSNDSTLYADDFNIDEIAAPTSDDNFTEINSLFPYTKSHIFKKEIYGHDLSLSRFFDSTIFNYKIDVLKPFHPFQNYEIELSKKYGICAIRTHFFGELEQSSDTYRSFTVQSFYSQIGGIADILNRKYGTTNLEKYPEWTKFKNTDSRAETFGKWFTKDMDIFLSGQINWENSSERYSKWFSLEYQLKDKTCHNDVKKEISSAIEKQNKIDAQQIEQVAKTRASEAPL